MRTVIKFIGLMILSILVFGFSFVTSYEYLKEVDSEINTANLYKYDGTEDEFLLINTQNNIIFELETAQNNFDETFQIEDENGDRIRVRTEAISNTRFKVLPPKDGYISGNVYVLTLGEYTAFESPELREIKKLVFRINRADEASYEFNPNVIQIQSSEVRLLNENQLQTNGLELNIGQIFFFEDENKNYHALKIESIDKNDIATYTDPGLDEVYDKLNIKGTFSWNLDDIITNPEIEASIVQSIRESGLLESLMMISYADERVNDAQVSAKLTKVDDQTIRVDITINILPGSKGLFDNEYLKHQKAIIKISKSIALNNELDIKNLADFSIAMNVSGQTDFSFSLVPYFVSGETNLVDFLRENKKLDVLNVSPIVDKLNNVLADHLGKQISLFKLKIPINVPGVYLTAEVSLFAEIEAAVDLAYETSSKYSLKNGIQYKNNTFSTFKSYSKSMLSNNLSLQGKVEATSGVELEIAAVIINEKLSKISLDPQLGLYFDGYATFPVTNSEINLKDYFYAEAGWYFSANANAFLKLFTKKIEFNQEIFENKVPLKTFGTPVINLSLRPNSSSVRALSSVIDAPTIILNTYDIKDRKLISNQVQTKDIKFYYNNVLLKSTGNLLELPSVTDKSNYYITAKYDSTSGALMSTLVNVVVSGSEIDGKVSTQLDSQSTSPIENAKVKVLNYDSGAQLTEVNTNAQGDFALKVSEGKYILVISALGFKELSSVQEVGLDEIKYTEHLLLLDTSQSGVGKVSGTIVNAVNGKSVSDTSLKIRENWNNSEGEYYSEEIYRTNSSGKYEISNLPVGYYTVEATKDGYYVGYFNILVKSNNPSTDSNFSISPILPENQIRIVLRWGASPSDLDSHMIGVDPNNSTYDVYYNSKVHRFNGEEVANLDVDDTSSYGPETVTIVNPNVNFVYAVHDFSNKSSSSSSAMSYSDATVTVFMGGRELEKFNIPVDQVGTYWTVFRYIDNKIVPVNHLSNEKPSP